MIPRGERAFWRLVIVCVAIADLTAAGAITWNTDGFTCEESQTILNWMPILGPRPDLECDDPRPSKVHKR